MVRPVLWADTQVGPYRSTEQRVKKFFRFGFTKGGQPQLRVHVFCPHSDGYSGR